MKSNLYASFIVIQKLSPRNIQLIDKYLSHIFRSPPLLILCNKQDSGLAKGATAVQTLLEKEIEKVKPDFVV